MILEFFEWSFRTTRSGKQPGEVQNIGQCTERIWYGWSAQIILDDLESLETPNDMCFFFDLLVNAPEEWKIKEMIRSNIDRKTNMTYFMKFTVLTCQDRSRDNINYYSLTTVCLIRRIQSMLMFMKCICVSCSWCNAAVMLQLFTLTNLGFLEQRTQHLFQWVWNKTSTL